MAKRQMMADWLQSPRRWAIASLFAGLAFGSAGGAAAPASRQLTPKGKSADDTKAETRILDDVAEAEGPARASRPLSPHPFANLSAAQLKQRLRDDPQSLGSISLGDPNGGRLLNGVKMPADPKWDIVDGSHAFGTQETVDYLSVAITAVAKTFPDTPPLSIGHISGPKGGRLAPHLSHQSGRDVDLGYYYEGGGHWYQRATEESLDKRRTWALVRALVTLTDVNFILMDRRVQQWVRAEALAVGEDPAWVRDLFDGTRAQGRPPLIRHAPGHATHLHVRFYNPKAQETARLAYSALVDLGMVKPPTHHVLHKVKKGETLIKLAKRYGTTVRAIKRANRLRGNVIFARKTYKIPQKGPRSGLAKVIIPPRRVPPREG